MNQRIQEEVALLKEKIPGASFVEEGLWVLLPPMSIGQGWTVSDTPIAFQFPAADYPQAPFYGFYARSGIRLLANSATLLNVNDPAPTPPAPFPDETWAFFSGNPEPWEPTTSVDRGSNVLSWIQAIQARFREHI